MEQISNQEPQYIFPKYHAISVDPTHFFYLCPHKACNSLVHFHGSGGDTKRNRIENRCSHCTAESTNIDICIDKGTLRKHLSIRGKNGLIFKKYKV